MTCKFTQCSQTISIGFWEKEKTKKDIRKHANSLNLQIAPGGPPELKRQRRVLRTICQIQGQEKHTKISFADMEELGNDRRNSKNEILATDIDKMNFNMFQLL